MGERERLVRRRVRRPASWRPRHFDWPLEAAGGLELLSLTASSWLFAVRSCTCCTSLPCFSPPAYSRSGGRGGRGRGRGPRLLNRGMNNGNFIGRREEGGGAGSSADPGAAPREDDHAHEAALGFPLHTDGPDRLGWLMNMQAVRVGAGGRRIRRRGARARNRHEFSEADGRPALLGVATVPLRDPHLCTALVPAPGGIAAALALCGPSSGLPPSSRRPSPDPLPSRASGWTGRVGRRCRSSTATSRARWGSREDRMGHDRRLQRQPLLEGSTMPQRQRNGAAGSLEAWHATGMPRGRSFAALPLCIFSLLRSPPACFPPLCCRTAPCSRPRWTTTPTSTCTPR
jgi:hypothetical protein